MHIFFFSSMLSGAKLGIGQWVWGWKWGRGRGWTGFERAPGIKKNPFKSFQIKTFFLL